MNKTYAAPNAVLHNLTGLRYAIKATPVTNKELLKFEQAFAFNFLSLLPECTIYKICLEEDLDTVQGLVAFKVSTGFLQCENMEVSNKNKGSKSLFNGIGKLMIALCCKISHEYGFGGFISFTSKNKLFTYYSRFGAQRLGSTNTMYIDEPSAMKLINQYF